VSTPSSLLQACVLVMCVAPLVPLALLSGAGLFGRRASEKAVAATIRASLVAAFVAAGVALADRLAHPSASRLLSYGQWFSYGEDAFRLDFVADVPALGFALLSTGICGVVAAFSLSYLHRERGFHRYFVQFCLFSLGITLVALAGSIEVLFAGWELLGLSSVLLVGFFHERPAPVANALRVFAVYRASDAAMLSAAVLLHHWAGSGSLSLLFSGAPTAALGPGRSLAIVLLLMIAVAGKSALLPFSGWLPRAMEGPTPSSAVYYGALSIHAGCFLLLRAEPLLAGVWLARLLAALAGAATALYAALTVRVQSDVKSRLSYAALTQVGLIVVEISLGWTTLAFVHIVAHACLRLMQFLGAPNVLHDLHELEDRVGSHVEHRAPRKLAPSLYLFALERGFVDAVLDRMLVKPFYAVTGWLDRLDRRLVGSADRGGRR
jgi:NADH:ubiquinone oxidoreductase subunit 5 (subunit L)/multisubunit Na+/H+ antiporter MnhA subunit